MGFWDTITEYADKAWDWITDSSISDLPDELLYTQGMSGSSPIQTAIDYGTGFFGSDLGSLVSSGAKAYLKSQKEGGPFKQTEVKAPKITRSASTVGVAGLAALRNPVGVNNPDVRAAMQRLAQRTNVNPQMQSISQQYMTKRQGARTMGLESSSLARVRTAPAASVRTQSTQEVVIDG